MHTYNVILQPQRQYFQINKYILRETALKYMKGSVLGFYLLTKCYFCHTGTDYIRSRGSENSVDSPSHSLSHMEKVAGSAPSVAYMKDV